MANPDINESVLQKSIILMTLILGILIIIFSGVIGIYYSSKLPKMPDYKLQANETQETRNKEIENYTSIVNSIKDQGEFTYNLVVGNTALTIFNMLIASTLGFIFVKPLVNALESRWRKNS